MEDEGRGRMIRAAASMGRLEAELGRRGTTIPALLTGNRQPEAFMHYPLGDLYDFVSHCQLYYHTHRDGEYGHAHLFLRPRGMPWGVAPEVAAAEADAPCHLVAVGFDAAGQPDELFTTNRWVTGEAWYSAASTRAMLPCFHMAGEGDKGLAGQWFTQLLTLFRPVVEDLVAERDAMVARWTEEHPGRAVLDDPDLEIISRRRIQLAARLAELA